MTKVLETYLLLDSAACDLYSRPNPLTSNIFEPDRKIYDVALRMEVFLEWAQLLCVCMRV